MSACFGIGFIAGPVIGGLLGDIWVRLPFLLRESRPGERTSAPFDRSAFHPLAPLR